MNDLKKPLFPEYFSHIYIEEEAFPYDETKRILAHFKDRTIVTIHHYKDLFNRSHQDFHLQKLSPCLILAKKSGNLIYPGAPVCQNFGHSYFYYTSSMMNCLYDCEYCYLQGMYPSANMVLFVNLNDIFNELLTLLMQHPVYLCISYDTDLLALEPLTGYVSQWIAFAKEHSDLTIELRTKSAGFDFLSHITKTDNVILAWTLSPDLIAAQYEHRAPDLTHRLKSIKQAMNAGYPVRVCFDPVIACPDWKKLYKELIDTVFTTIDASRLMDASIGIFRVSTDYLKHMRKIRPDSPIIQYPYTNDHGVSHYGMEKSREMITFMKQLLLPYLNESQIFIWEENDI